MAAGAGPGSTADGSMRELMAGPKYCCRTDCRALSVIALARAASMLAVSATAQAPDPPR
jgi:hypothetical protein